MTVENISWSISKKEYCRPRSPVGRRIQLSHRGRHIVIIIVIIIIIIIIISDILYYYYY